MKKLLSVGVAVVLFFPAAQTLHADLINIASSGTALKKISVPTTASPAVNAAADELMGYLAQISSGTFQKVTFDPAVGPVTNSIVIGNSADLNLTAQVPVGLVKQQEHYLLASANNGAYIVIAGASDLAVTDAVYDFLYSLGCRWYFPGSKWEIIPSATLLRWSTPTTALDTPTVTMGTKSLAMKIFNNEIPDYVSRFIWHPYHNVHGGNSPYGEWMSSWNSYAAWSKRNKNVEGISINFHHNYAAIVTWAKKPSVNRWKPEYYALIGGVRGHSTPSVEKNYQLCVSNPEVVELCRDWALQYLADPVNSKEISVSMEPNDGSYWCECDECEAIQPISSGFVTDRVVHLANAVAEVIPADRFVGILSYGTHAAPPSEGVEVNDKIYVNIATGFLTYGYTFNELLSAWGALTPNVGVYDYLSNLLWDINQPARSDGGDLAYMQSSFGHWNLNHADNYNAQSTHASGPFGLGHYVALKLLWDTSLNVNDLKNDFITKCFGTGTIATAMHEFYDRIDKSSGARLSPDLIGRMFRNLDTAYGTNPAPAVVARLDDLATWLKYCEMRLVYDKLPFKTVDPLAPKQGQAEAIMRHTWKMRATDMVDSLALWRMKPLWDDYYLTPHDDTKDEFDWPINTATWNVPQPGGGTITYSPGTYELNWSVPRVPSGWAAEGHPWKEATTYTHSDSLTMVSNGIVNNPLLVDEPKDFDSDLVFTGTAITGSTATTRGSLTTYRCNRMAFYLRSNGSGILPTLNMSTGWSSNRGPARWVLYTRDGETAIQQGAIEPDEQTYQQTFNLVDANKDYLLIWDDGRSYSKISWDPGAKVTMIADSERPYNGASSTRRYFYVPKGTKNIVAYSWSINPCTFYNAAGALKHSQATATSGVDITIPVADTEDDQIWYVNNLLVTDFFFQNIPGVMAARPDELLIPKKALVDLYPYAGSGTATRGSFLKMIGKNSLYLRGDATNVLPTLTITAGISNPSYGDATWTLYTENGKTALESGTVPATNVPYTVSFTTVPDGDNFLFVYDDKKSNSSITWTAGKYVNIAADAEHPHSQNGGVTRRYFYVPKGATSVDYRAASLLACKFYKANGTLKYDQPAATNVVGSIPVAPGEDDQVWYVGSSFGAGAFYFVNIPGHLVTRPDELLVPQWTKYQ